MQPSDHAAERAILGALLADGALIGRVRGVLAPPDFLAPAHAKIYDAMIQLSARGQAIDHLTVTEQLRQAQQLPNVGGPAYLMDLDQQVPFASNVDSYCRIVKDRSQRRRLQKIGARLLEVVDDHEQTAADLAAKAARALAQINTGGYRFRTLREVLPEVYDRIHDVQDGKVQPVIPTGIQALDAVIGGIQRHFIVLGGRTGAGKSAVMATLIQNMARQGIRVGVFSLEDAADWLAWRYLSMASGVNQFVLKYRRKSDDDMRRIGDGSRAFHAYDDNVLIDDRSGLSSTDISFAVDDMVLNYGCQAIVVDHLNEMNHHVHQGERHDLKIAASLTELRDAQKRHGIPLILGCQLTEGDKDDDVPTLNSFMHAREIGKKSRVALAVTRKTGSDTARIHVLKQTDGKPGVYADVRFVGGAAMIADVEGSSRAVEQHGLFQG